GEAAVNETASCTVQLPGETGKAESLITLRPVWSMVSVFGLCIGTSVWLYFEGSQNISSTSGIAVTQQYTMWATRMIVAAICGGLGLLAAGFSALAYLRKKSLDKLAERDKSWQRTVTGLQLQLTEMQMVEEQLREMKSTAEKR